MFSVLLTLVTEYNGPPGPAFAYNDSLARLWPLQESSHWIRCEAELGTCYLKLSTQDNLLGKPTLDFSDSRDRFCSGEGVKAIKQQPPAGDTITKISWGVIVDLSPECYIRY